MELRHLRYFVALSETLHFGQAAANLQIAQPSLSHQIRQLETELGTALLRRTRRRVELTDAGRVFLTEARDIVARADRAAMIARRTGHADGGRLRIGVGCCMDQLTVGKAVSLFNRRHQAVRVEVQTLAAPRQATELRDDRLDVGFTRPPVTEPSLSSEILCREPLMAALPSTHRLARKRAIPLSALAHESFIVPPRELIPVFHDIVLRACREAGFVPNAQHEADHLLLMLGMAASGSGIVLVPASARKVRPHRLVFVPLRPSPPALETAISWRRENISPVLSEFVTAARRVFAWRHTRRAS